MGHVKAAPKAPKTKAVDQAVKFQSFGFLADHYPQMAKQALAIQAKGTKATKSEAAKLRSLKGWNHRYSKMAGFVPKVEPKAKTAKTASAQALPDESSDFDGFDVVQLQLTGANIKTDPDYSPNAPVVGRSHYIVLRTKKHRQQSSEVVLLHPFTCARFTLPELSFQRALLPESLITPKQALEAMAKRIRLCDELKREVPMHVLKVQAALAKAVNA